jgi:class 3 adenylate cyclase
MPEQREFDASPISVAVQRDGAGLVLLVSDGRSICRLARSTADVAALGALSAAATAGAHDAARALWRGLFPGAVGEFLGHAPPRALTLQLPPELDALAWEAAASAVPLGSHFAVTRQLLFDDEFLPMPAATTAEDGVLRALSVVAKSHRTGQPRRIGALAHRAVTAAEVTAAAGAELLATHDVVFLDANLGARLPALLGPPGPQRLPHLFVLCGSEAAAPLACLRDLARRGLALLVSPAARGDWADVLCDHLAGGLSVAEAVRRLRAHDALGAATLGLRLYGPSAALVDRARSTTLPSSLRQVTTLSFDMVDSTRLLQRLGDERYSELLETFHGHCSAIVRRHGGQADDPQGDDGVMSYFGFPQANEDAAMQAVAAGLEIAESVQVLGVQVRVGIATGRVAVRYGQPVGVSIHLAARLQKTAAPGAVLVAEATHALVGEHFTLRPILVQEPLKGIDGEPKVYQALRPTDGHPRVEGAPAPTPFVGREVELGLLTQHWALAVTGSSRVVLVLGEAGIGKSRLALEFQRWLADRGERSLECRCLPDGRHSAFFAIVQMLRRFLRLQDHDAAATQMDKIQRGLPEGLPDLDAARLVAMLLSVEGSLADPPAGSPERLRERTVVVLLAWFRAVLQKRPVCLIVEDLHWIDPSTRVFLGRLLDAADDLPLLALATRRSEADSGWAPAQVRETILLRGLPPVAARWLARQASGGSLLTQGVLRLLAARTDGVPLFLEESVRMAIASGAAEANSLLRLRVPATLQDLLMSRLDRVGGAKVVAQLGAALGREFPTELLRAVIAHESTPFRIDDLARHLRTLEAADLLLSSGDSSEPRLQFKHALVCDIAHQSMWERDRQLVHRAVAAVIAARFPALAERQPEMLARHLAEAGMVSAAVGQWELAARRAAAASAHDEAISHIESALALLPDEAAGAARERTELRLQLLLASRYIATEGYGADRVERLYARAAELCQALGDNAALLKVQLGLQGWHFMRADLARAAAIAAHAESVAATLPDPMQRLQASWAVAVTQFHQGDAVSAMQRMDACLAGYRRELHRPGAVQDPGVMCLCYTAWGQWELGHADDALTRINRVVELAQQLDHKFSLGEACGFAASVHLFRGETELALAFAERSIAICEEGGFAVWLAHALVMRGRLRCEAGASADGLADMNAGYTMWLQTGAAVTGPMYLTLRAEGMALAGLPAQGLALLDQALGQVQRSGERYHEAEIRRLRGELTLQLAAAESRDASAEAETWLLGAHALAVQQHKQGFVLRAAMALARLWWATGRAREARQVLEAALANQHEGRTTRDVLSAMQMMLVARHPDRLAAGGPR